MCFRRGNWTIDTEEQVGNSTNRIKLGTKDIASLNVTEVSIKQFDSFGYANDL